MGPAREVFHMSASRARTTEEAKANRLAYMRKWRAANLLKVSEALKAYHAEHPNANTINSSKSRRKKLERIAGREQPENCEVCNSSKRISFDHCHKSKKFRGWLCHGCNVALGYVKDNSDTLRKLADYLDAHKAKHQPARRKA